MNTDSLITVALSLSPYARKFWLKKLGAEMSEEIIIYGSSRLGRLFTPLLFNFYNYTPPSDKEKKICLNVQMTKKVYDTFVKLGYNRHSFGADLDAVAMHSMMDTFIYTEYAYRSEIDRTTIAKHLFEFYGITQNDYDLDTFLQSYKAYRLDGKHIERRKPLQKRKRGKGQGR